MTIRKKAELEKVISKGGHVTADLESKKEWSNFTLRIKSEMLNDIDRVLEHVAGLTKTGFILQAIQEKIRRMHE